MQVIKIKANINLFIFFVIDVHVCYLNIVIATCSLARHMCIKLKQ